MKTDPDLWHEDRERVAFWRLSGCFLVLAALLLVIMLFCVGCQGTRSMAYKPEDGFTYMNAGQDTAFGALDVSRTTTTETVDPETGKVTQRVIEETTVKVDAYQGVDAIARAASDMAKAAQAIAEAAPGN